MLQNECLVAKIGFDTEENEPSKVWTASQPMTPLPPRGRINSNENGWLWSTVPKAGPDWTLLRSRLTKMNESSQILRGSFSAVWTAKTARIDAFVFFRDLQDVYTFAPLWLQNFNSIKNRQHFFANEKMSWIFSDFVRRILHFFLRIFDGFFSGFRAKFQKIVTCVAFSIKFAKTNQKFVENSEFCENYSLLFKIIHWCP